MSKKLTLEQYLNGKLAKTSAENYLFTINHFLKMNPKAKRYKYVDLVNWLAQTTKRYPNIQTSIRVLSAIKKYYDYLVWTDQRNDNPCQTLTIKKGGDHQIQFQNLFTSSELEMLLNRENRYADLLDRNKVLISLMIYQGLTSEEVMQMDLDDVDLDTGKITLRTSGKQSKRKLELKPNQIRTGAINTDDEQTAKQLLRNCMRVLKPYSVVNYFADKLTLPVDAKSLRRLNEQFQDFICQITILHQFQRKTDPQGRLITTKEDVRLAVDLFFTAIVIKVDEIDASTRQFFDNLKAFVKSQDKGSTYKFTQREIRQHLKLGNTTMHKYIKILQQLEYVQAVGGSPNTGYKYVISYWDNLAKTKERIKEDLNKQLDEL